MKYIFILLLAGCASTDEWESDYEQMSKPQLIEACKAKDALIESDELVKKDCGGDVTRLLNE